MIRVLVVSQRSSTARLFETFFFRYSRVPTPKPIPDQECSVTPPIFTAAMPVLKEISRLASPLMFGITEAVTATVSGPRRLR